MKTPNEITIEKRARKKGFCIKASYKGAHCLIRAVSNALFFTETFQESIRNLIKIYFRSHLENGTLDLGLRPDFFELFAHTPFLPEFERINLEIVSRLYNVNISVYSNKVDLLYNVIDPNQSAREIHIIRLGDTDYAMLEQLERVPTLLLAQNIVLSVIESVAEKTAFQLNNYNKGRLINFDYFLWRLSSGCPKLKNDAVQLDFRQNIFINSSADLAVSNSVSEKGSFSRNSKEKSVGSDIVSIMKAHQKQNMVLQPLNSFEIKCEQFLNSSGHTNSHKEGNVEASEDSLKLNAGLENRKFVLKSDDNDSDDSQLNKFSSKIYGNNNNLSKSVSILRLNNIFQPADMKGNPGIAGKGLMDRLSEKKDSENRSVSNQRDLEFENVWNYPETDFIESDWHTSRDVFAPKKFTNIFSEQIDDPFQIPLEPVETRVFYSSVKPKDRPLSQYESEARPSAKQPGLKRNLNPGRAHPTPEAKDMPSQTTQKKASRIIKSRIQKHDTDLWNPYIQNCYMQHIHVKHGFGEISYTQPYPTTEPKSQPAKLLQYQQPEQPTPLKKEPKDKKSKQRYREKQSSTIYTGILKFFDDKNGFGFVTSIDKFCDSFDVFIYQNEFKRAKIDMEIIRLAKKRAVITLKFQTATYKGKNSTSKKAINVQLIDVKLPTN